jgi:hypothetical protein
MSTEAGQGQSSRRYAPNNILIAKRKERKWSRPRAARELQRLGQSKGLSVPDDLDTIEKAIYRHETGRSAVRDPLYVELYCMLYNSTAHELFGDLNPEASDNRRLYDIRSHKFIAAHIGADAVRRIQERADTDICENPPHWLECQSVPVKHGDGRCRLYLWPFGTAIFHLIEDLKLPNVASLATWRVKSYDENLSWATQVLQQMTNRETVTASYVLSLYWLSSSIWASPDLDTALRMICMPRVLLERDPGDDQASQSHAELVERALLAEGFEHEEMRSFGLKGIATGYASWSGVVYHPIAPRRALHEDDLVHCELAVQAIWAYCEHINNQVEQGLDPSAEDNYDWRFLRGARSKLTNPRSQETGQHRSMRDAILETSSLIGHLDHAIDILRETSER